MRAQRSGRILTISSSAGFTSGTGRVLYSASKFAVEGLSAKPCEKSSGETCSGRGRSPGSSAGEELDRHPPVAAPVR
ncbi:SDR family NAD(P)-dependent oxidoreductase [Amycolatopsis sp. OK19-0408]|uniref:SDR family NAD(P)-dependent oxidoreductase n=2 Tax=Amycolatopsis iheyensis TaxID=2945988 RepID=A0A9X2NLI0_9PSEU|nr:SDR family NAD(P)-dependent oxidoreductase [Amycolatopsis iheyensis]MCR6489771.1 SDR family NAD(P)-dependent oxidoreductase [Amycolatopsis iheyensis]